VWFAVAKSYTARATFLAPARTARWLGGRVGDSVLSPGAGVCEVARRTLCALLQKAIASSAPGGSVSLRPARLATEMACSRRCSCKNIHILSDKKRGMITVGGRRQGPQFAPTSPTRHASEINKVLGRLAVSEAIPAVSSRAAQRTRRTDKGRTGLQVVQNVPRHRAGQAGEALISGPAAARADRRARSPTQGVAYHLHRAQPDVLRLTSELHAMQANWRGWIPVTAPAPAAGGHSVASCRGGRDYVRARRELKLQRPCWSDGATVRIGQLDEAKEGPALQQVTWRAPDTSPSHRSR